MTPTDTARAHVDAEGAALDAVFAATARGTLEVRYRLRNTGNAALAVFDRGDRHAVLTGRQMQGAAGIPYLRDEGEGRVTLSHVAQSLPTPAPTVPPTPLARRVEPGGELAGEFAFSQWLGDTPVAVRWCLGVAPADAARLLSPEAGEDGEVWRADFAFADAQRLLCTPWFDLVRGTFLRD
ncbi:hypothetical protein [Luteimonas sp. FCS-9]|uniref:hypothetical protein n=1 Tax=Luteimonas sp. FCS-9 TaxID=1547516 RepID=UPI00063E6D3B|nr:hypothetical protein [Luteimonas sp. FCS-9]KLJ02501.1 hypothetical protein WQ56_02945 [Luteimonas sp. FCS-9]